MMLLFAERLFHDDIIERLWPYCPVLACCLYVWEQRLQQVKGGNIFLHELHIKSLLCSQ